MTRCGGVPRYATRNDESLVLAESQRMHQLRVAGKRGSNGEVDSMCSQQVDATTGAAHGE